MFIASRSLCPVRTLLPITLAGLLLLLACPTRAADAPAALEAAPSDAHLVVIIPSLSGGSEKLAAMNNALGLDVPELRDVLGRFKTESGALNGLDDEGALLIAVPNVSALTVPGPTKPLLVIAPVTDYEAFISNYQVVTEEGSDIATLTLPRGQTAYARPIEGYAVLSPVKAAAEAYQPAGGPGAAAMAGKLGAAGGRALAEADAAVYLDLEGMAPVLTPLIDVGLQQANAQAQQMGQMGMDAEAVKSMQASYAMYAGLAKTVLRDAAGGLMTLGLTPRGNAITFALQFKPDTPLAQMFPGGGEGPSRMLTDLPDKPYIFAGAMDARGMDTALIVEELLKHLPAEEDAGMLKMTRQSLPMLKDVKGWAGAFYAPAPGGAMGMFNMLQIAYVDDPAAYMKQTRQQTQQMNGMTMPAGAGGQMTFTTTYQEKAMEIEGTPVDQYSVTMQLPPAMQQSMMPLMMMMGGSGYGGYIAAKDDAVLSTTVTDPNLITAGLKAVGAGAGIGADPALAELRDEALPDALAMEGYLSLTGIARTANPMMQMFGMPAVNVPADLPPIAFGLGVEDSGLAYRVYVPNATVKFLIDEGKKLQGNMGGPGQAPPF
ncbi:MAG: hypothetical protein GVY24_04955 [Planctomycetes bacterium]|jgi:hypothetical protein|nr:hypothetical protein [Planctomycetota bacterium]